MLMKNHKNDEMFLFNCYLMHHPRPPPESRAFSWVPGWTAQVTGGGGSNLPMFIQVASSCSLSIKSSVILIYTIYTICKEKPLKKALGPSLDALLFLTLPTTHTSKILSQPSTPTIVPSGAPKPTWRLHPVGLLGHYHTSLGPKHCLGQWLPTRNSQRWWLVEFSYIDGEVLVDSKWLQNICSSCTLLTCPTIIF